MLLLQLVYSKFGFLRCACFFRIHLRFQNIHSNVYRCLVMATVSKHKKVKIVKQKLKLFRANEPLKSVLMWGINYSFSTLNHVKQRALLLKDDFKAYMKVKVNNHSFNKDNMPSRFKFKEYCPMVFKSLRDRFAVNKMDYWDSFTRHQPSWDSTRGKSGSKFLVTYNRQFLAKTISSEEVEQLHQMLEEYYSYIVKGHGQTLLPQFLGLYRLTVNDQETYILVMRNVFSPRLAIHKKYDLKNILYSSHHAKRSLSIHSLGVHGSTQLSSSEVIVDKTMVSLGKEHKHCLRYKKHSVESTMGSKPLPTLKDADFLTDLCKIHIGEESKKKLLSTLECDIQFLQENNLIDYSLLIGVHDPQIALANSIESAGDDGDVVGGGGGGGGGVGGGGSVLEASSRVFEDKVVSAGDGLGTLASQWQSGHLAMTRSSIVLGLGSSAASSFGGGVVGTGNVSTGDDDEDEEEDGISIPENNNAQIPTSELTPPDSPLGAVECLPQLFSGELHPNLECYGIKSSTDCPHRLVYFVAIIDILTRYGMRKRTAQTYKTVKHGADGGSVKPEFYGRRLLDLQGIEVTSEYLTNLYLHLLFLLNSFRELNNCENNNFLLLY
ncbi:Phosphatidylinositol 5-phosphate 4-kinase type-2 beta [Schistosoma japonicum]|nr:Phosphatidylinositol 5-phosphate 4-kinase type-2 beta [Schistosoma japonicum]